jgi:hypothetical protein
MKVYLEIPERSLYVCRAISQQLTIEIMSNTILYISGYYKDDKTEFEDYKVVSNHDFSEDDDDTFYYGLSESGIISAIEDGKNGVEDGLDFVITSYRA